ncbi:MAG: phenylalanine--tRNA ligase subunit beta [Nitrospirae bacterium]|nr:phenylalanine--tRNA ligase subunit beta [Nitrospirota bacterium]
MKVSLKWLKEFVDFSLGPGELASVFTMSGLEVEGMEEYKGDTMFDINVTPNRPDCLSIIGIARELSAILETPLRHKTITLKETEKKCPAIKIIDADLCLRYSARVIRDVKVGLSPSWITERLLAHGIRPVNNIVDITNYVLLEMGHPLHAFDMEKLSGDTIRIARAGKIDKFTTLDAIDRSISPPMLLIWDSLQPIAIAGVMGGLNTAVSLSTKNVLLESAYFDPISIRRTSRELNLKTEASYRFERGTDIEGLILALDRAAQLIAEVTGGPETSGSVRVDEYPKPFIRLEISIRTEAVQRTLGIKINGEKIKTILSALGMKVKSKDNGFIVTPPTYRRDLCREVDLIEEVARIYGYDKILAALPQTAMIPGGESQRRKLIKRVKESLGKSGYSEAINYSFMNPASLDILRLSPHDHRRNFLRLRNPLRKEEEALRTTLVPSLLSNLQWNTSRGIKSLKLFEVSKVFSPIKKDVLPEETTLLSAVCLKDRGPSLYLSKHDGLYDLKGALEALFIDLKINYSFIPILQYSNAPSLIPEGRGGYSAYGGSAVGGKEPYLHPGKSCMIKIEGEAVGFLGSLHPDIADALDIRGDISLFELNLDKLLSLTQTKITYQSIPKYPYVERDMAIIVPEDITANDVEMAIKTFPSEIIESVSLFDIYTGKPIPEGGKSLAFSIRYRAKDRTLTDDEVDSLHLNILESLKKVVRAELRT